VAGIVYMVGSTLLQLAVGLWMALVLNRITRGQKLLTAVVFTAYLIPTIIVSLVAMRVFDPSGGVFQMIGAEWLGLWGGREAPLGSRDWAMRLLILIGTWKFAVFVTIFTLAQLRAIPDRFYEAAKICGANRWQMFRDITLPRLMGIVLVVVLLRSVFMFNKFDIIWQLTEGGPGNATTTLPVLLLQNRLHGPGLRARQRDLRRHVPVPAGVGDHLLQTIQPQRGGGDDNMSQSEPPGGVFGLSYDGETRVSEALKLVSTAIIVLVGAWPIYWMTQLAFTQYETVESAVTVFPTPDIFTFDNFNVLTDPEMYTYMFNTVVVAIGTIVTVVLVSLIAGYGLARLEFPRRRTSRGSS